MADPVKPTPLPPPPPPPAGAPAVPTGPAALPVYDRKTGKLVTLPWEQAEAALAAGSVVLRPGTQVTIRGSDGQAYQIPSEDLQDELARYGSRVERPEEAAHREVLARQGDRPVAAAALGAGRVLSFGGTDFAARLLGVAEPVQEIAEANPEWTTGGEIVGLVGGLLTPGGAAGLLGKTAGAATAPVRGLAAAGRATERLVERIAGKGIAGKALSMGAGGALEGAGYGLGQFVSEASLGEIEPTAESLIDHVGMGAVWGGGMGGALGGGFTMTAKAAGKINRSLRDAFADTWAARTGTTLKDGVKEAWAGLSGALTGKGKKAVLEQMSEKARLARQGGDELRDEFAKKMAAEANVMEEAADKVFLQAVGKSKRSTIEAVTRQADPVVAANASFAALDQMGARLDGILTAEKGEFGFLTQTKKLREQVKIARREVEEALKEGNAGRMFNALDDLKRDFQHTHVRATRAAGKGGIPSSDLATLDEFRSIADDVALASLEKPEIWGKSAAGLQSKTNAKWRAYLQDIKRRMDHRLTETWEGADFWERGKVSVNHKASGYRTLLDDAGSVKVLDDASHLTKQLQRQAELLDTIAGTRELGQVETQALRRWHEARGKFEKLWKEADEVVGAQNQFRALEQAGSKSGLDASTGAAIGGMVGGPFGALAGGILASAMSPGKSLRQMDTLKRILADHGAGIRSKAAKYAARVKSAASATARTGKRAAAPAAVLLLGGKDRKARIESYRRDMDQLTQAVGQPDLAVDRLSDSVAALGEFAPNVADVVGQRAAMAARMLLDAAPRPRRPEGPYGPRKSWEPSDQDLDRWASLKRAVDKPSTLLDDILEGRVDRRAVAMVEQVYPSLISQMRDSVRENLDELREDLPYDERVRVSVLLGVPVEESAAPERLRAWRQVHQMISASKAGPGGAPPGAAPAGGGIPAARLQSLKPENTMTEAQRLEAKA